METNIKKLIKLIPQILGDRKVLTIFELGARDCNNTEIFHNTYTESKIYAFECNPNILKSCGKKIRNLKRAKLIEKAVTDKNGTLYFYPVDQDKSEKTNWSDGNPGASSILKISNKYPDEKLVQYRITVPTIKLSSFIKIEKIKYIDLLFMDIQGAELLVLKGLEESINKVKIINTEVSFLEMYEKQPLFKDIKKFLNDKGFALYSVSCFAGPFADMVFINKKLFNKPFLDLKDVALSFYYSKVMYKLYAVFKRFKYYKPLMRIFREIPKKLNLLKFVKKKSHEKTINGQSS